MANPVFSIMGNQNNSVNDIIKQAQEFKKTFNGNPREEVQKLLNSGKMSQQEFNRLSQIAQQVVQTMGGNF